MIIEDLRKPIKESLVSGQTMDDIYNSLIDDGFSKEDVIDSLKEFGLINSYSFIQKDQKHFGKRILSYLLVIMTSVASLGIFVLNFDFENNFSLIEKENVQESNSMSKSQTYFIDSKDMIFPDEHKFITKTMELIEDKSDFVNVDLRKMKITLYKDGIENQTLDVLTKGKDGSWWETPTGNYTILSKSINGYSTIGNVWMPYSMQFYGNYLVHGWPHYDDGTPVASTYSGGCIRLSTEDAKKVYEFVSVGTPILVLEDNDNHQFGVLKLNEKNTKANLPKINAKAFLISNLSTGEIILEKNIDEKLPVASLTKLMTAIVAHEIIYLGKTIKVTPQMAANVSSAFNPNSGDHYIGLDLLYPLLMQSSNETAKILSGFVGENVFIQNMNIKAKSLQMDNTTFADSSGISAENISSVSDISKLLEYIFYKRSFIFDISLGKTFENVGYIPLGNTVDIKNLKNFNEFIGKADLIGVKNGQTTAAKQTLATVWNIKASENDVPVAIIVLGSEDREKDTEALLKWLKDNYTK